MLVKERCWRPIAVFGELAETATQVEKSLETDKTKTSHDTPSLHGLKGWTDD